MAIDITIIVLSVFFVVFGPTMFSLPEFSTVPGRRGERVSDERRALAERIFRIGAGILGLFALADLIYDLL